MNATAIMCFDVFSADFDNEYKPLNYPARDKYSTSNDDALKEGYSIKVRLGQIVEFFYQNPLIRNLEERIFSTIIPKKWHMENVEEPNYLCKKTASAVAVKLYWENQLFPERIGASIEGGIMLHFVDHITDKTLSIEIYNDLEIAAIVNHGKKILRSADIFNMDFKDIIREYAS